MKKSIIRLFSVAFATVLFAASAHAYNFYSLAGNTTSAPTVSSAPGIYTATLTWRVNGGTLVQSWQGGTAIYNQNLTLYAAPGKEIDEVKSKIIMVDHLTHYEEFCYFIYRGDNTYDVALPLFDGYRHSLTLILEQYNGTGHEELYFELN